mmetsp:Transcript_14447/g.36501  ORF Transcript_14447/g.36501 Transcript_14447/m.36501 type:complete len:205 (+) Transcript_14447:315-929(+)
MRVRTRVRMRVRMPGALGRAFVVEVAHHDLADAWHDPLMEELRVARHRQSHSDVDVSNVLASSEDLHVHAVAADRWVIPLCRMVVRPSDVLDRLHRCHLQDVVTINIQLPAIGLRVLRTDLPFAIWQLQVQVQVINGVPHEGDGQFTGLCTGTLEQLLDLKRQLCFSGGTWRRRILQQPLVIRAYSTATAKHQCEESRDCELHP